MISERGGSLRRLSQSGQLSPAIQGLPKIKQKGQGGLLGLALHPDFKRNNLVYFSYTANSKGGFGTEVARGVLQGNSLMNVKTIFVALESGGGGRRHFGSRLVFASDGTLFISLGDRGNKKFAQDLNDHRGSLIRINDDGTIPPSNPFVGAAETLPAIYSYGHRNIQGMSIHPVSSAIWTHEHGPQGGDEINIIKPGANYGWPVITYGVNYGIGTKIGEGTHKPGMLQPVYHWVPSIAPSGMSFYTGKAFPQWRNNLFVGALKFGLLVRLELTENRIVNEERLLNNAFGRIRDVVQGPDGLLYLLTDDTNGRLLRISPLPN